MSAVAPKPTSVATVAMPSSASPRPAASSGSHFGTTSAFGSAYPALRRFLASSSSSAAAASRPDHLRFPGLPRMPPLRARVPRDREPAKAGVMLMADPVEVERLEMLVRREVEQHHDEQH